MEQKKILWIIISAAVFLCIVLAAGLLWLYPSAGVQTAAKKTVSSPGKADLNFDPVEWVRNSKAYPGISAPKEKSNEADSNFTIVYGETDGKPAAGPKAAAPVQQPPERVPVVRKPAAVSAPERRKPSAPAVKPAVKAVETHKAVSRSVQIPVREYWIQAGSFKSRTGAEGAKETLSREGLTSRITIKTLKGVDYYRVRIGPYSKKAEAEKFLAWVKRVKTFKNSYISQVISRR